MDRRTLLRRAGAAGALALAGCTGNPGGAPGNGTDGEDTPTEAMTNTDNSRQTLTIADTSFEVLEITSGTQVDRAEVTFDAGADAVRVAGTIPGSDGCKTAVLDSAEYDAAADELTVTVATVDREGTEDRACTQAIVEITYEASVTFDGGLPAAATVVHDGEVATEARRDGADVADGG